MHIYFSGIGGVALGPLAQIAADAGYKVSGSDPVEGLTTRELQAGGIEVIIYPQDGSRMQEVHDAHPIDWFVYTSALAETNPELVLARSLGIRVSKRDELLAHIIQERSLKLIAVSGTHGKTTTTGMAIWLFQQLGIPISYSVGTTLSFGPGGLFDDASDYFVYECDEYDYNFLAFHPFLSLITTIDHDHFDIYPSRESYEDAFRQFVQQSGQTLTWPANETVLKDLPHVRWLQTRPPDTKQPVGTHNRQNAWLIANALAPLLNETPMQLYTLLADFPGTNRRFERLAPGLYSDYGHHPVEIAATLQLASELSNQVVLVYQPHQNARQVEIINDYTPAVFEHASKVYWLPTYLVREPEGAHIYTPQELTRQLPQDKLVFREFGDQLWDDIERERATGKLVLGMGAGTIDSWLRSRL